jgi:hypothetical protein
MNKKIDKKAVLKKLIMIVVGLAAYFLVTRFLS